MLDPEVTKNLTSLVPKIYEDGVQPSVKVVGNTVARTITALLSPVRGLCWGFEKIEKMLEEGLEEKLKNVSQENRKTPDPEIAVPLLQALSYTAQNEDLREMYLNLLANSMNSTKDHQVHPSFVEIIKQMNSLDAKVFKKLSEIMGYQEIVTPKIKIGGKEGTKFLHNGMPERYIGWVIEKYDIFDVGASMIRLNKFGLITFLSDHTLATTNPGNEPFKDDTILNEVLENRKIIQPDLDLTIIYEYSLVYVNQYGRHFMDVCI